MSNTPRTDAATVRMERLDGDIDEVVSADFARTLERELIAARSAMEETAIGHARYEYVRTLNPREFAALFDEALRGERFDDLVDRHRMKKEPVDHGYDRTASLSAGRYVCLCGGTCSHHDAGGLPK